MSRDRRAYAAAYRAANKDAIALSQKAYRDTHKTEQAARDRAYYIANPEKIKAKEKQRIVDLRKEVLDAYGQKCACSGCSENNPLFLTVDHINNDGAAHRRELANGTGDRSGHGVGQLYRWLKKQGFPRDRFRILCFNCNCGRARNGGICPHEVG